MNDDTPVDFASEVESAAARNIKAARERTGLSQAEVAKLLTDLGIPGMHQTTIARIESGQRSLRLAEAIAIARLLEYRVEDLVESSETAALRSYYASLRAAVDKFREAGKELAFLKFTLSETLDERMPFTTDGTTVTPELLRVEQGSYHMLDELLWTNSSLDGIAGDQYDWLCDVLFKNEKPIPFSNTRLMDLLVEAHEGSFLTRYRLHLNDRTESSDAEFEAEVLERFEGAR